MVAKLLTQAFPRASYFLNDWSPECAEILQHNFPESLVTCGDGLAVLKGAQYSLGNLVWVDFNNFSWRTREKYREWFVQASQVSEDLVFTDSSVYGLTKFKGANLRAYGVESIDAYFRELLWTWLAEMGWHITAVSYFGNASFIVCRKSPTSTFPVIAYPAPVSILPLKL